MTLREWLTELRWRWDRHRAAVVFYNAAWHFRQLGDSRSAACMWRWGEETAAAERRPIRARGRSRLAAIAEGGHRERKAKAHHHAS